MRVVISNCSLSALTVGCSTRRDNASGGPVMYQRAASAKNSQADEARLSCDHVAERVVLVSLRHHSCSTCATLRSSVVTLRGTGLYEREAKERKFPRYRSCKALKVKAFFRFSSVESYEAR